MKRSIGGGLVLSLALAVGCEGSGGGDKPGATATTKPDPSAASSAKVTGAAPAGTTSGAAGPAPTATSTATAAADTTATSAAGSAAGVSPGAGLSAVPSKAEWDAAREVTVNGSSSIGCETKAVREYLRVSCSGNTTGGTPTAVNVTKGAGRPGMFTFSADGITSLIVPFIEGVDVVADFSWSNGTSYTLTIQWPRGAPKPSSFGVFGGYRRTPQ